MSHTSRIFDRVPIDLPNRSGFDLSHQNGFTATCGTLTPALSYPLLPNETVSLGVDFQVQLPPMVTDFYGKVDAVCEAFFVPNRLLWGGWESFITHPTKNPVYPEDTLVLGRPTRVPCINLNGVGNQQFDDSGLGGALAPSSLADYLGIKQTVGQSYTVDRYISAMKFLAYHRIYDDWYRDTRIQAPLYYAPNYALSFANAYGPACIPYVSVTSTSNLVGPVLGNVAGTNQGTLTFSDGISLMSLRQRNWSKGYFTAATLRPQAGSDATIEMTADENGNSSFSITQLRAANSLQKWNERNNFSYRYADQIYGQFGVYPDSARMDRVVFLGRVRQVVYNRSVMQTATDSPDEPQLNNAVASKKASSMALGEGSLIKDFRSTEHGYLFVIFSLVPHAYYSTGSDRDFERLESEDFPFPLLAGMGDQQIHRYELTGITANLNDDLSVFGWNDLYAEYKYIEDQVHGLMRDGSTLDSYMIQRSFSASDAPELSSEFLRIPRTALDQVQAVSTAAQGFSCWTDMYFTFKKTSPLPAYSLPTLADMKDTHTGHMSRGGTSL